METENFKISNTESQVNWIGKKLLDNTMEQLILRMVILLFLMTNLLAEMSL